MPRNEFHEIQKYTQWWLWSIVIATAVLMIGINAKAVYQQFILDQPWGDSPLSDTGLTIYALLTSLLMIALLWMFSVSKLEVMIDKWGIHYRYYPLIPGWKYIPKDNIREWKVKKYFTPGYGIRFGLRFKTLNVKGNMGLELRLHSGKNLRLGTQKPLELQQFMEKFFNGQTE